MVAYLRRKRIVHRDLKSETLLLSSHRDGTSITLGEFGFAREFDGNRSPVAGRGTPG